MAAPFMVVAAVTASRRVGRVFDATAVLGRNRYDFELLRFAGDSKIRSWPVLLNVLRGEMSLCGPRPVTLPEVRLLPIRAWDRFLSRPGVVSIFWMRRRMGIAYDSELEVDRLQVFDSGFGQTVGLLLRSLPVAAGRRPASTFAPTVDILGIEIRNSTMAETLDWMLARIRRREPTRVAFVNPDCLNIACRDPRYRSALDSADLVLPDGFGLRLAARLLGTELCDNINGTDLFPRLCAALEESGGRLYLLGARPGVAARAAVGMQARFPSLSVAGHHHGYFSADEQADVIGGIKDSKPDALLVAFGAPRQDVWVEEHQASLETPLIIGVGGLFDFYSGRIPRAPMWMRELGLEWCWRMLQEPGRLWRRYVVGNPLFLLRVLRQRLTGDHRR
ncbi:MAG: WecB/TagA/CpsF family glycosyltransferase [Acidobacteriota bacterium]